MKKIPAVIILCLFLSSSIFAKENFLSFTTGLSSGYPFYGSEKIKDTNNSLQDAGRGIFGFFFNLNLNVIEQCTFFVGADLLTDLIIQGGNHSNHLHFGIPFGVKLYPNLKGFNFGIAYMLGFRADFIDVTGRDSGNEISSWGNGFKLFAEYNFAKTGKSRFLPSVGLSYSLMPRGHNTFDNLLGLYLGVNF